MQPHIMTTYNKDGTMKQEPVGFGGKLCKIATAPYEARQGRHQSVPTPEASEPPAIVRESDRSERA